MELWKDSASSGSGFAGSVSSGGGSTPLRESAPANVAPLSPETARRPAKERAGGGESTIAAGLTLEGKIVGSGSVRIAGRFKGDVQIDGALTLDSGARLEGQVKAGAVIVSGELVGNITEARQVDLLQGGRVEGDVKAGSFTVASGARMRGKVEFGWEEDSQALSDTGTGAL